MIHSQVCVVDLLTFIFINFADKFISTTNIFKYDCFFYEYLVQHGLFIQLEKTQWF